MPKSVFHFNSETNLISKKPDFRQAMDFLKEALKSQTSEHKPAKQPEQQHNQQGLVGSQTNKPPHRQPSTSELTGSAKVVAGAAKATLAHKSEEIDKKKVAGAAGDLLGAAKHYGKLDEKQGGLGKYVGQAESYLHKYESSHSGGAATAAPVTEGKKKEEHGGGGYGDYMKMAEGFLKK